MINRSSLGCKDLPRVTNSCCGIVLWCCKTHACLHIYIHADTLYNDSLNTVTDTWQGYFYMCIVLKTCVLRRRCEIFNNKDLLQNSHWANTSLAQREPQHLARQTLLMDYVAGGVVACFCDITIYPQFGILFELGWKDQGKVFAGRHILTPPPVL